ncbi:hypothetical protein [Deinococcus multiflagellatus]|uniref:Uncharacterized protein n=1 Tax=Deinococcus multiflagellatus TaxID=1656887 RepID=A0ABW1ZSJ1_9DEIO
MSAARSLLPDDPAEQRRLAALARYRILDTPQRPPMTGWRGWRRACSGCPWPL